LWSDLVDHVENFVKEKLGVADGQITQTNRGCLSDIIFWGLEILEDQVKDLRL
jgi:hypothetical protein